MPAKPRNELRDALYPEAMRQYCRYRAYECMAPREAQAKVNAPPGVLAHYTLLEQQKDVKAEMARLREVVTTALAERTVAEKAIASVFDIHANLEQINTELWKLKERLGNEGLSLEAIPILAEIRKTSDSAVRALDLLYEKQRFDQFIDAVFSLIDECDPDLRPKLVQKLRWSGSVGPVFGADRLPVSA